MSLIGKTVTWKNRPWEDGNTGVVLAIVKPREEIRDVITRCGVNTRPFEVTGDGHLRGARYAKIGSIISINERYLIDTGRYLYAPRTKTVNDQNKEEQA